MIYVLGCVNNDITLECERLPKKGETITAEACRTQLGGKGACQAAAVARLSARRGENKPSVKMIGRVGKDAVGSKLIETLRSFGVDTEFVRQVNRTTGSVFSFTSGRDKRAIVYGGANNTINKSDIDEAFAGATDSDTFLCQLEAPLYIVAYALRKARMLGMTTVLKPAPFKELPEDMFYNVDILVANAEETQELTGVAPDDRDGEILAAERIHSMGVPYAVITLGERGVAFSDGGKMNAHLPARKVSVVDTTGVGDTFVGALALTYPQIGMYSFGEACGFAVKAASITASRLGGIESVPTFDEVCALYNNEIKRPFFKKLGR
ncbi:MAG: ribokinase [Roseburia sp.]|nr:ribokinase [Roseburia sp.]